jgi:hypothetical protein
MSQPAKIKALLERAAEQKTLTATAAEAKSVVPIWQAIDNSTETSLELRSAATIRLRRLQELLVGGDAAAREQALGELQTLAVVSLP